MSRAFGLAGWIGVWTRDRAGPWTSKGMSNPDRALMSGLGGPGLTPGQAELLARKNRAGRGPDQPDPINTSSYRLIVCSMNGFNKGLLED